MTITLDQLNSASPAQFVALLDGTYEHSPWIAERAAAQRPIHSLAHLKLLLAQVVREASLDEQLGLLKAHPELAGKAMVDQTLTEESTHEQSKAGLNRCTPAEFARIQELNADYNAKFGFPFILAVRGPRGVGYSKADIIATLARRVHNPPAFERAECLRQVHRIAEIRLNDKFGIEPRQGQQVWDWAEALAVHSEPGYAERGELTVTYLSDAHRACAQDLKRWMQDDCGFDDVHIDAVGNVVGTYYGSDRQAPHLLTGSHYDTVRNGGKYDGRLGILVPMACVKSLAEQGRRLPFGIEVVAFSEEEGQRFKATFLASSALTGDFDPKWLDQQDSEGISLRAAMQGAGLRLQDIDSLKRDPARYLGFVEVHIEQGPVLNAQDLPLGVVTSINGSVRFQAEVIGMASHAGTTPMDQRQDAAAAVAEIALYLEQRARQDGDSVATIGQWSVPYGSINVVPGRCLFSLDLRAPNDAQRDALIQDVVSQARSVCERRGVQLRLEEVMRASAAPSDAHLQARWEQAVQSLGLPVFRLPSGAGHDAMKLHTIMPQAMLFVRGENAGISHNPLESSTCDDIQTAVDAFMHLLKHLVAQTP